MLVSGKASPFLLGGRLSYTGICNYIRYVLGFLGWKTINFGQSWGFENGFCPRKKEVVKSRTSLQSKKPNKRIPLSESVLFVMKGSSCLGIMKDLMEGSRTLMWTTQCVGGAKQEIEWCCWLNSDFFSEFVIPNWGKNDPIWRGCGNMFAHWVGDYTNYSFSAGAWIWKMAVFDLKGNDRNWRYAHSLLFGMIMGGRVDIQT